MTLHVRDSKATCCSGRTIEISCQGIPTMCIVKENSSESAWRNIFKKVRELVKHFWNYSINKFFLFDLLQPLKPKLPRQIVRSAKVNLNRYWHKFEEMMTIDNPRDNQDHLNNHQASALELTHLMAKSFTIEKNLNRSGRYRNYHDDSLYHGVNLNNPNQNHAEEDDNHQNELLELLQHPIYNINFNFN